MHGRRKVKTTEDKLREKKEADKIKAAKYSKLISFAFDLKSKNDKSETALKITGDLLSINADCYTFWNYRREIILDMLEHKSKEEINGVINEELSWVERTLAIWPKSYWVWFHRKWLSKYCDMNWTRELELCFALHKADSRNFHCWNYRRYAASQAGVAYESELKVAQHLIEDNFSNYSAWHHRSIYLPKAYDGKVEEFKSELLEEFEKVKAAFYTEPEDQSAWFYHRWLVGVMKAHDGENIESLLRGQLETCQELLEIEEESKWAMLTIVFLMMELKSPKEEILPLLTKLKQVDSKRKGFYEDLENKC